MRGMRLARTCLAAPPLHRARRLPFFNLTHLCHFASLAALPCAIYASCKPLIKRRKSLTFQLIFEPIQKLALLMCSDRNRDREQNETKSRLADVVRIFLVRHAIAINLVKYVSLARSLFMVLHLIA